MRIGIDIGGTFTDLVLLDEETGEQFVDKILTTSDDPSVATVNGFSRLLEDRGLDAEDVKQIVHGTTLVINAIVERKGAPTALVTTAGFRDVLEIGREKRYDIYDLSLEMPEPLVPRNLRYGVTERMDNEGRVFIPLDEGEARRVVREIVDKGIASTAVCFLHSFRNSSHEIGLREIIQEVAPEMFISLSSEVVPEIREYERTSTTAANAYTQPLMKRYISTLRDRLEERGFKGNLFIMLSGGGITTPDVAERFPIRVVESGPAAGAIAAAHYGREVGLNRVISFDMGGTTAKICLINGGRPSLTTSFELARVYRFKKGSGLPIKLPVIEMIEIGAGGGSIARVDAMGLLKVGPESAGTSPGPACYGLGGTEATVTDADLILGYLNPDYFLGGRMKLDAERARESIERLAEALGVTTERAAWGVHQVVNENMANAARIHAVEHGHDPSRYAMIAFGGAGPVHAYWVGKSLRAKKIIVPPNAGVASAFGFLATPFSFDFVRTHMAPLDELDLAKVNAIYREMAEEGKRLLLRAGVKEEDISFTRTCDMRYVGQGFEIAVPMPEEGMGEEDRGVIRRRFDEEYLRIFHRTNEGSPMECLNWRLLANGPDPKIEAYQAAKAGTPDPHGAVKGERMIYFPSAGGYIRCRVYDRYSLSPGSSFQGPAVVEERESTTVVGADGKVSMDESGNLVIDMA